MADSSNSCASSGSLSRMMLSEPTMSMKTTVTNFRSTRRGGALAATAPTIRAPHSAQYFAPPATGLLQEGQIVAIGISKSMP